ncbi:ABC transporter ATP-binding protein [Saccharicrinis sp. FJH62]|uniref:ABC transporter ATP-binding protein n=1 Tax=Saccharicrinis sp. FJH62 TaxID=3344657 RepID=UPI0035D48FEC
MDHIIEISDLTKKYGEYSAVNHLSLNIAKGEIFGLLGPNGAGKSTTILMLMGLTEPYSGRISVCGINPVKQPIQVKKKVGYLPEDVGFYDDYSGLENLIYTARLNGLSKHEAEEKANLLMEKVGLGQEKKKKTGKYSRGMRQRLGFADVLIKDPEVIILDEPTLGIDPSGVKEFLEMIVELSKKEKMTVLLSSHHLYQIQKVCDRVGIFVKGNLLAEGDIQSLSAQLFTKENTFIEGDIDISNNIQKELLLKGLKNIEDISEVRFDNNHFNIRAQKDVAAEVSRFVINSGAGLLSLNKKILGLDDIYERYFQGAETTI